ncbi:MAG: hypothetical protein AAGA56_03285 [Myxococcota bacterium]
MAGEFGAVGPLWIEGHAHSHAGGGRFNSLRLARLAVALLGIVGCAATSPAPSPPPAVAPCASTRVPSPLASPGLLPPRPVTPDPTPSTRFALGPDPGSLALAEGRWAVRIETRPRALVTLAVMGPRSALRRLDMVAPRAWPRLRADVVEDDRLLPYFTSWESPAEGVSTFAVVDVDAPVELRLVEQPASVGVLAKELRRRRPRDLTFPLIGLPQPMERYAGYFLQYPHRYQFVRADVATALRHAFRQTRLRFRRGSFGIGDASQWNGRRPASDQDQPRHISHEGGRDVDIGLPMVKGRSRIERRCRGVTTDRGVLRCAPGSERGFDAARLAYFLGLLIDGPTPGGRFVPNRAARPGPYAEVEVIFTDQSYIEAVHRELPELRKKGWIHDEAFGALGEQGLLRASPWHTDHVHIRFTGQAGLVSSAFDFRLPGQAPPADLPP